MTLLLRASLFSAAILVTATMPAAAFKKVNIGTRTKEYMQSLCTGDGRQYVEGQGQYGCISNCGDSSKESDACGINCSEKDNQCYGWTPAKRVTNPNKILGRPQWGGGLPTGRFWTLRGEPAPAGMPLPPWTESAGKASRTR